MTPTEIKLIEKIVRAKVELEKSYGSHSMSCPAGDDGPCTCGASAQNSKIEAALRALDLEK